MLIRFAVVTTLAVALGAQSPPQATAITEAQARDWAATAAKQAQGDQKAFEAAFDQLARAVLPSYPGNGLPALVLVGRTDAYFIYAIGQVPLFEGMAGQTVRKMDPLGKEPWPVGTMISLSTKQIDSPNFQKIVVRKNGEIVEPLKNNLAPVEKSTRMGAKRTVVEGQIYFDPAVFSAGADITITAIPDVGSNVVKKLSEKDLAVLR